LFDLRQQIAFVLPFPRHQWSEPGLF